MIAVGQSVFWACAALVVWSYAGYPALMSFLARAGLKLGNARRRPPATAPRPGAPEAGEASSQAAAAPKVSVLIAAYNEEAAIEAKLRALLASEVDGGFEILVASDGSADETVARARGVADPRVRVLDLPRGGKTTALNSAAREARGEILVMTDATTELLPTALQALVREFDDPSVGCVAAELVYVGADGSAVAAGTGAYWRYERAIRGWESRVCSLIGCSGALYAVRACAHRPIDPELDDDFTMPWEVYDQGYRTVLSGRVEARESANDERSGDFRMRVRVALRAINALVRRRRYLNPLRSGWFACQLGSHKALRYLAPWLLVALVGLNAWLAFVPAVRWLYAPLGVLQAAFYLAALAGVVPGLRDKLRGVAAVPYYFAHLNAAALVAWTRYFRGDRAVTWTTER